MPPPRLLRRRNSVRPSTEVSGEVSLAKAGYLNKLLTDNKAIIIDVQCVTDHTREFIKEMCILEPFSFAPSLFCFTPPYDVEKDSINQTYLEKQINGLSWNVGTLDYNRIGDIHSLSLKEQIKRNCWTAT